MEGGGDLSVLIDSKQRKGEAEKDSILAPSSFYNPSFCHPSYYTDRSLYCVLLPAMLHFTVT